MNSHTIMSFASQLDPMAATLIAVLLVILIGGIAGVGITGSMLRRVLVYLLALTLLAPAPWIVSRDFVLGRLLAGFAVLTFIIRGLDLVRASTTLPALRRFAHAISVVDSTQLTRVRPGFDRGALTRVAIFVPLAFAAGACVRALPAHTGTTTWIARMAATLVMTYALVEVLFAVLRGAYAHAGFKTPTLHDDPVFSRSLQEFWAERWNRPVQQFLWRHGFLPLARRGHPRAGILAAFALSAALHVYLSASILSARMALVVGGFFLVQGALIVIERVLRVSRWPSLAARAWTVAALVSTVPFFLQGVLDALGW